jgi:hypothetical protein
MDEEISKGTHQFVLQIVIAVFKKRYQSFLEKPCAKDFMAYRHLGIRKYIGESKSSVYRYQS